MPVPLHTKQAVDRGVAPLLLNCLQNGKHVYCSYRQERLVEKIRKISTTVSKGKLPKFNKQPQKTQTISTKEQKLVSYKDMIEAQRSMDIAHDVLSASPLLMVTF